MKHSNKILAQQVVQACAFFGIEKVVISPGSRNAPLIIELNATATIQKYSIVDERSAAFFALGMAQQTQALVALVCSSGSALVNYYPAIVEAFYSKIPLVVISADRPKHLIDIGDGQTIRQENIYKNHILFEANLDEGDIVKNYELLNKAFQTQLKQHAPIHINVPFSEPLYETTKKCLVDAAKWDKKEIKNSLLKEEPIAVEALQKFANLWNTSKKKMILLGVNPPDEMLQTQLNHIIKDPSVIVLTENTSNVANERFIDRIDQSIFSFTEIDFLSFKPELLLTFGGMVVSKKIKDFLRKHPPKEHWHIDATRAMDTYHCLTHHFTVSATLFFSQFFFLTKERESSYQEDWLRIKNSRLQRHKTFETALIFSDFKTFSLINKCVPEYINIQFSNSSIIRYAQLFSWKNTQNIGCNRGASGIDGSSSTAVGVGAVSTMQTLLITGDISFFYDSNALWNSYIPNNFRIILINNKGGGIFKFIPGPSTTDAADYFETPHNLTAVQLCEMHGFSYRATTDETDLEIALKSFFDTSEQPKLLEIFTPREVNAAVLKDYFSQMH